MSGSIPPSGPPQQGYGPPGPGVPPGPPPPPGSGGLGSPGGWYGGPPPYGPPPGTNGFAVASLVVSLMCLPPVALVLGIIALFQIRKKGQSGKGMAVAGVAVSGASLALVVAGLILGLSLPGVERDEDGKVAEPGRESVFAIEKGDCFNTGGDLADYGQEEGSAAFSVELVPCDQPHESEAYGAFDLEDEGSYPGVEKIGNLAEEKCWTLFEDYVMDTWSYSADVGTYYYHPEPLSWSQGDREVLCFTAEADGRSEGSVRADAETLTPGQLAYLEAVRPVNDAEMSTPEPGPETDLKANTDWAGRTAEAQAETVRLLKEGDWPAGARGAVGDFAERLEKGLPGWQGAAEAESADAFYEDYATAYDNMGQKEARAVREALGLATDTDNATAG